MATPLTHLDPFTLPCMKCTGVNGAHRLTCPTVNLPARWSRMSLVAKYGPGSSTAA